MTEQFGDRKIWIGVWTPPFGDEYMHSSQHTSFREGAFVQGKDRGLIFPFCGDWVSRNQQLLIKARGRKGLVLLDLLDLAFGRELSSWGEGSDEARRSAKRCEDTGFFTKILKISTGLYFVRSRPSRGQIACPRAGRGILQDSLFNPVALGAPGGREQRS